MTHEFLVCLTEPVRSGLSVSKPHNTHPRVNHTLPNDSLSLSGFSVVMCFIGITNVIITFKALTNTNKIVQNNAMRKKTNTVWTSVKVRFEYI